MLADTLMGKNASKNQYNLDDPNRDYRGSPTYTQQLKQGSHTAKRQYEHDFHNGNKSSMPAVLIMRGAFPW